MHVGLNAVFAKRASKFVKEKSLLENSMITLVLFMREALNSKTVNGPALLSIGELPSKSIMAKWSKPRFISAFFLFLFYSKYLWKPNVFFQSNF